MSEALIGYGTQFRMAATPFSTELTKLAEVTNLTLPNEQVSEVDVTHYESANRTREFIPGLNDAGEITVEINWVPGGDTDLMLIMAKADGRVRTMQITTPPDDDQQIYTFPGFIRGFERAAPIDDRMTATVTIRIAGSVVQSDAGAGPAPTPAPYLQISSAVAKPEGAAGGSTVFSYTLTLVRDGSFAAYPFTWAVTGTGSNPANAADFGGTLPSGSGTFAANETIKTITVLVSGDATVEPDEQFQVTVTAPGLSSVTSSGTIQNDDTAPVPAPTVSISAAVSKVEGNSGATSFDYTLTLNRDGSTAAYPFTWSVSGNGSSPAAASDFVGGAFPSGSGTFAAGETTKTISVPVAGDTTVEPDEQFVVSATVTGVGTATSGGTIINDDTPPVSGLDPNYPVAKMIIPEGTGGTFPPVFDVEIPTEAQAGNVKYRFYRYLLTNPNVVAQDYSGTITDAQATANAISGLFTSVTEPSIYEVRLESLDGTTYGNLSNRVLHGDVTAPNITTATTGNVAERAKLAVLLTVSNEPAGVDWAITGGADKAQFEIANNTTLRWLNDGAADFELPTDFDANNTYEVTLTATDKAGNSSTFTRTQTVTDVDEIVDNYTFDDEINATKGTAYTRQFTVSGLASGVNVPITVSNGLSYKKGSGSLTTTPGTVVNGDVVTISLTASSADATKLTAPVNVGGVIRTFSVQTALGSAAAITSTDFYAQRAVNSGGNSLSLNFGVGTGVFAISVSGGIPGIANVLVDGVAPTLLYSTTTGDPIYVYAFASATAGGKTITYDCQNGAYGNHSLWAFTSASTKIAGAAVAVARYGFNGNPFTVPAVTVPATGLGVLIVSGEPKINNPPILSNNLTLDRVVTGTGTTRDSFASAFYNASGTAQFGGSSDGYYTAHTVMLQHA